MDELEVAVPAEAAKPWWKRRRARATAALMTGALIALGCHALPEAFRESCRILTKLLELFGV
jgi:hypothetical protein